jgi:glycosyl transferase family 25
MLIEATLEALCDVRPVFAADIGAAVDWRNWSAQEIAALRARAFPWCDPSATLNPWWTRHLKLGEIACTLSHWNVWTFAQRCGFDGVIVLEDDAKPEPEFAEHAARLAALDAMDPEWDLLYLGRARVQPDRGVRGAFVLPGFSYHTHAYALSSRGVSKMLATNLDQAIIPADEFLPAMFMEHPRADVRQRFPPTLHAYAFAQDIVNQHPKQRYGSDTEESPFLVPTSDAQCVSVPGGEAGSIETARQDVDASLNSRPSLPRTIQAGRGETGSDGSSPIES